MLGDNAMFIIPFCFACCKNCVTKQHIFHYNVLDTPKKLLAYPKSSFQWSLRKINLAIMCAFSKTLSTSTIDENCRSPNGKKGKKTKFVKKRSLEEKKNLKTRLN